MGLNRGYVRRRSGAEVHATVDYWVRAFYLLRATTSEGMKRYELYRRGRVVARGAVCGNARSSCSKISHSWRQFETKETLAPHSRGQRWEWTRGSGQESLPKPCRVSRLETADLNL